MKLSSIISEIKNLTKPILATQIPFEFNTLGKKYDVMFPEIGLKLSEENGSYGWKWSGREMTISVKYTNNLDESRKIIDAIKKFCLDHEIYIHHKDTSYREWTFSIDNNFIQFEDL